MENLSNHSSGYKIIHSEASKINFFAGKEKNRLKISELDQTNQFAIALLDNKTYDLKTLDYKENTRWVPISVGEDKFVKAEISSIAARMGISEQYVIDLQDKHQLDSTIKQKILTYESNVNKIIEQVQSIDSWLEMAEKSNNPSEFKPNIIEYIKELSKKVDNDPELLFKCNNFASKCELIDSHEFTKAIRKELDNFTSQLSWTIENHEKPVLPREKVVANGSNSIFKDKSFIETTNTRSIFKEQVTRLCLLSADRDPKNKYAVKTDGYIYKSKPLETDEYIPYSENNQDWVLINIKSLSHRTGIPEKEIKSAAIDDPTGANLSKKITDRMSTIKKEIDDYIGYRHLLLAVAKRTKSLQVERKLDSDELSIEISDGKSTSLKIELAKLENLATAEGGAQKFYQLLHDQIQKNLKTNAELKQKQLSRAEVISNTISSLEDQPAKGRTLAPIPIKSKRNLYEVDLG